MRVREKSHFSLAEPQEMRAEVILKIFNNWHGKGMNHAEGMLAITQYNFASDTTV